jgi:hypothetical protein
MSDPSADRKDQKRRKVLTPENFLEPDKSSTLLIAVDDPPRSLRDVALRISGLFVDGREGQ